MMAAVVGFFLSFFILTPIWLVLLYQLLSATNQPTWVWGLYWVYIPLSLIAIIIQTIIKAQDH